MRGGVAAAHALLGLVAARGREQGQAADLHRHAFDVAQRIDEPGILSLVLQAMAVATARRALGDEAFEAALARGRALGPGELAPADAAPPGVTDKDAARLRQGSRRGGGQATRR